jgi:hypothetical protein
VQVRVLDRSQFSNTKRTRSPFTSDMAPLVKQGPARTRVPSAPPGFGAVLRNMINAHLESDHRATAEFTLVSIGQAIDASDFDSWMRWSDGHPLRPLGEGLE